MKTTDLRKLINRNPFRPFAIRVASDGVYTFQEREDVGATKDGSLIFHFGDEDWTEIETKSITEIIHTK
jgi:hypothetical protein